MKRVCVSCAVALSALVLVSSASAEVRTRDKGQVKFEGMLGRMVGMFGGKAAKEGVVSTTAVKGDRKATINEYTGHIVDLSEEKIYELDMKKKTYEVTTFEELRRRMREAEERAAKDAKKEEGQTQQQQQPSGKELEIDFNAKETGQKRSLAGYDAREVIMTITVREKGQTLEESGGLVMTADSWLGPEIPEMRELAEFELRYLKAIAPEAAGVSAEQMAAVMAMYPMIKQAMERMNKERVNLKGTPLAVTTTFEAVKSPAQMEQQQNQGGSGVGGMLARRMMKKDTNPRATIFTVNTETLEVSKTVDPADLQVPADFKQKS